MEQADKKCGSSNDSLSLLLALDMTNDPDPSHSLQCYTGTLQRYCRVDNTKGAKSDADREAE